MSLKLEHGNPGTDRLVELQTMYKVTTVRVHEANSLTSISLRLIETLPCCVLLITSNFSRDITLGN